MVQEVIAPVSCPVPPPVAKTANAPALSSAAAFLRRQVLRVVLCSAVVLVPCFWTHHIQTSDLGSHVYNAWLAQLIHQGQAPGLHIVRQGSNVLFDLMLSALFPLGAMAAEKIAVSVAVMVFFWGAFSLCSAAAGRAAWSVVPLLAMVSYGFVFNMGFFNLYLSVGVSCFALALVWTGRKWDLLLLPPLIVLVWMGHLLGMAGMMGVGAFLLIARLLPLRYQLPTSIAAVAGFFAALLLIERHYQLLDRDTDIYWMAGADQVVLHHPYYEWVGAALVILGAVTIATGLLRDWREVLARHAAWLQLYVIAIIILIFAPGGIWHATMGIMGYVPDRASLYAAVLGACIIAITRPGRWQIAGFACVAIVFFSLSYRDARVFDGLETKVDLAVQNLPAGRRVVSNLWRPDGSRILPQHWIDRACIGHCLAYANYEPSSSQFRIKADPGNSIVAASMSDSISMQAGIYRVRPEDLPLTEVYRCGSGLSDVCVLELHAGELNGEIAYQQFGVELESALKSYSGAPHPSK